MTLVSRYYIYLQIIVGQDLLFFTSCYICSRLLVILFPDWRCPLKTIFFWKTMLVIILWYDITLQCHSNNLRKLKVSFFIYLRQMKICIFARLFGLINWTNQTSFALFSLLKNIFINVHYLENEKYHDCWKLLYVARQLLYSYHPQ